MKIVELLKSLFGIKPSEKDTPREIKKTNQTIPQKKYESAKKTTAPKLAEKTPLHSNVRRKREDPRKPSRQTQPVEKREKQTQLKKEEGEKKTGEKPKKPYYKKYKKKSSAHKKTNPSQGISPPQKHNPKKHSQ